MGESLGHFNVVVSVDPSISDVLAAAAASQAVPPDVRLYVSRTTAGLARQMLSGCKFLFAPLPVEGEGSVYGLEDFGDGLHPWECRDLAVVVAREAKAQGRRVLASTNCPTVLDGLDLGDDGQRLYVAARGDDGRVVVDCVRTKPRSRKKQRLMLSEMWVRGLLGVYDHCGEE